MSFRMLAGALVLSCAAALVTVAASAQQFPSKAITIFVGYGAGGTTDTIARMYAAKLSELLKTPVVVENRPGASELRAIQPVIAAAPDGHTLYLGTGGALGQGPVIRKDLNYDPMKNFAPVAMVAVGEAILVVKVTSPVRTLGELIKQAKANPGKLTYGSGGVGSGNHLVTEYILLTTQSSMLHVPFKSDIESTRATVADEIDFLLAAPLTSLPFIREGKLRPIAVTGPRRLKALPEVPTAAEAVPELKDIGSYTFFGLVGPAGMPQGIVQQINEAVNKIALMPDVAQSMREKLQLEPATGSPAVLSQHMDKELTKWRSVGNTLKIEIN